MKNIFSFWKSPFETYKQREDIFFEKREDEHIEQLD